MDEPKFTPGPWAWFGNAKGNLLYLATIARGRQFVMQFARWGMARAQPVFQDQGVMKPAVEFLKFEVGNPEVTGFEAAKADSSVYRFDVLDIEHPDARLIAAAPDLYAACRAFLAAIDRHGEIEDGCLYFSGRACPELHDAVVVSRAALKLADEGR